jgi:RNA polymerase sigma factor (sigma-70 family)
MIDKENQYLILIKENRERISKIASFYCNSTEDRADLVQEIAYQVWKSFDSFRSEAKQSTWLYKIAINTAIQYLKKKKKMMPDPSFARPTLHGANSTENEQLEEHMRELMNAIQQLKQLDKAIILLYLEEKNHAEIAAIVNLSISNVGTRIQRIKKKLKSLLNTNKDGLR